MTNDALRWFADQGMPSNDPTQPPAEADNPFYLYHVTSGTRIYDLYCLLDRGEPPNNPNTLAYVVRSRFGDDAPHDYSGPWAMATLGGAGGQTIVGAFSTGTHGGDVGFSPIADCVQAIHLVGPKGSLRSVPHYWLERPLEGLGLQTVTNVVDDELLAARYPGITVLRDPDIFNAAIVAAGRLGIIYSVVLRVVRQYALTATASEDVWSTVKAWLPNPNATQYNHRFVQVVVNPYSRPDSSDHSCFIVAGQAAP
jgi:FAD/FMN-containing dehydrogenase